jgi:hypothetical protein
MRELSPDFVAKREELRGGRREEVRIAPGHGHFSIPEVAQRVV